MIHIYFQKAYSLEIQLFTKPQLMEFVPLDILRLQEEPKDRKGLNWMCEKIKKSQERQI